MWIKRTGIAVLLALAVLALWWGFRSTYATGEDEQAALAATAIHSSSYGKQIRAIEQLTDQDRLIEVVKALREDNWPARQAAVARITDQAFLADLAKNDKSLPVREAAVKNLTDQALLADVAINEDGTFTLFICPAAVEKLTDQAMLAMVAKTVKAPLMFVAIRQAAVEKLTDQAALADIAKEEASNGGTHALALERLTDETWLADVAQNAKDDFVRTKATFKLTDPALLADLAQNADNPDVRQMAKERQDELQRRK